VMEQVKAARKQSREEEIRMYGKSINYQKVMTSKNVYNRKKNKADDEVLPYFFVQMRQAASLSTKSKLSSQQAQTLRHRPEYQRLHTTEQCEVMHHSHAIFRANVDRI
jgi:hypothetical protein